MGSDFGHLRTSASAAVQVESSTHAHPWMPYIHSTHTHTHTHTWQIKRFSNILNNGAWNTKIKSSGSAGTGPSTALEAHESTTHMNFSLLLLFLFILLFFWASLRWQQVRRKTCWPISRTTRAPSLGSRTGTGRGVGGGRGASTSTEAYITLGGLAELIM